MNPNLNLDSMDYGCEIRLMSVTEEVGSSEYLIYVITIYIYIYIHIMEGRVKILETYQKSEEIFSFYPIFLCILQTFIH